MSVVKETSRFRRPEYGILLWVHRRYTLSEKPDTSVTHGLEQRTRHSSQIRGLKEAEVTQLLCEFTLQETSWQVIDKTFRDKSKQSLFRYNS